MTVDLYQIFERQTPLDRDAIERLRKALNEFVAYEIQTNHGGHFALSNLITVMAVAVFNQDGNLMRLVDALATAASTLHQEAGMPYTLAYELQQLSEKLFPTPAPTDPLSWEQPEPVAYPIPCVLVHLQTGESLRADLYEEEVEIDGVRHSREFMRGEDHRLKYKIVALEQSNALR